MVFYDPTDPRWSLDPGAMFDEVREHAPIHRSPDNVWVLSRHVDVLSVLRDRSVSSDSLNIAEGSEPRGFNSESARVEREMIRTTGVDNRPFLFRDPPDHTRLRGLVQKAFTPRRIAELGGFVTDLSRSMVKEALAARTFDAVATLAWPLPVAVICEMLAIPSADHARFQAQSAQLARGLDPDFLLTDDDRQSRDLALLFFFEYFNALFEERRRTPGDDLLSAMVTAHDGTDQLTEGELLSTAILLLVAGHETTMNLISGALWALSRDPAATAQLRQSGVTKAAVDELLRMVSPVQLTARSLLDDITVSGVTLERGSFAMLLLGAANRDPAVFEQPATLKLDRDPNPQMGFGFGVHYCLGAPLARLEAQVLLQEFLDATRTFEVLTEPRYRPNVVLRGLESLEMTVS